ncbi:MAG TPA: segregation/condensation protein A [Longimicrobiales bacterium]|nr:segregation/condensation protein A [Longimicrobiales bacterium]
MERPSILDAGFVVELDRFQGPLDLLLHLIREQDVDIFDIPIAQITAQFLRAIDGVAGLGLDRAGEFLEMAATLVRIKAQMLLPRPVDADGELEDPRAELVRRLLEYEHFREVARRLEAGEAERSRHFGRGFVPPRPAPRRDEVPLEVEWADVWAAALRVGERAVPPAEHLVTARAVPLEDKLALITDALGRLGRVQFRHLVVPFGDRLHAVVTFMAGLELSRRRLARLRQRAPFAELWIYRREEADSPDAEAEPLAGAVVAEESEAA